MTKVRKMTGNGTGLLLGVGGGNLDEVDAFLQERKLKSSGRGREH